MKQILFALIILSLPSCNEIPWWDTYIHQNEPEPIVVDSCHTLTHLTDTAFVCLSTAFDSPYTLVGFHWYGSNNTTTYLTLQGLLDSHYPLYHSTYYQNDKGITMFIDGTDNSTQFNGKIGVIAINQPSRLMTADKYAISDHGSLTFEQECFEADRRLNIHFYTLSGTNFTQEQNDIIIRKRNHFQDCKHGEIFADFSYKSVSQSVRDSTSLYLWDIKH